MARVVAALAAIAPAAGQLFALQYVEGKLFSPHPSIQLWKTTPTLEGLQYAEVGPKYSDIVLKSTSTCLDSPSGVYYFVGGKSNDVKVKDDYTLYGISTDTGEQVSQFQLPTPNSTLMLSFVPMEWKLGCDQTSGVLLYGEWDGTDEDPPKEERTLWRYDTKTQALEGLAQLDADAYAIWQQSFPDQTYNQAVDAEDGLVSIIINAYSGGGLTVVDTTNGTVRWQVPGTMDAPDICAQVYDPVKKRFFGIGTLFDGPYGLDIPHSFWWDATTQPQKMVQMADYSDCSNFVSTVDVAARAAIFEVANMLTTVSLDTGEIMSEQSMPDGYYLFQQKQTTSSAPELAV